MTYFMVWASVAVLILIIGAYIIGRFVEPGNHDVIPGVVFVTFCVAIFWPLLLVLGIICAPFYLPYKYGVKQRITAESKKKTWDTLKK